MSAINNTGRTIEQHELITVPFQFLSGDPDLEIVETVTGLVARPIVNPLGISLTEPADIESKAQ